MPAVSLSNIRNIQFSLGNGSSAPARDTVHGGRSQIFLRKAFKTGKLTKSACQAREISGEFVKALHGLENAQIMKNPPDLQLSKKTVAELVELFVESQQWNSLSKLANDVQNSLNLPKFSVLARIFASSVNYGKFDVAEAWLDVLDNCYDKKNVSAYKVLMRSYFKVKLYDKCASVFERLKTKGLAPDLESYCIFMSSLRNKCQWIKLAETFEEMKEKQIKLNIVAYSIVIDSLGKEEKPYSALALMRKMQKEGLQPDEVLYNSLIHAFASAKMWKQAQEIFHESQTRGDLKDLILFTTTIQMQVEAGYFDQAMYTLKSMKQKNIQVTDCLFCTLVKGFGKKKSPKAAINAFEEVVSLGFEPGQLTCGLVINFFSQLGMYGSAEGLLSKMQSNGLRNCVVAFSNLIDAYGKIGNVDAALRIFHKMRDAGCLPNVWVYNSLIHMYGMRKDIEQVEKLLCEMKGMLLVPDNVTYTSVMASYSKMGQFEKAVSLFKEFKTEGGKVDRPMAGIMINAFSKANKLCDLLEMLQELDAANLELDSRLRRSALNALRDAGLQTHVEWFRVTFMLNKQQALCMKKSIER
eukprot:TRINITY_DN20917_c0_g1_i1.p1 TRINITY_DN20917_c0_g1~~TRINITY_DN20917_c0_g1_i1.p1  ORF type:complete len:581 (+),score=84.43 TRINITY_DN20917_c0_g1_i1:234-1976(+)